jgi:CelD/BcsL family acetyltransferase involved in cellulose biosynthesis
VRRRLRDAGRNPDLGFEVVQGPEAVEAGIAAYEAVYARSWKEREPFPRFNAEMMRQTAGGALRLGLLRHRGQPVAAQIWVRHGGMAAVLKLAHDEAFKAMSPGTMLTALMLRQLFAEGGLESLDFGRGDDPYKRLWTSARRQRIGVVLANPLHPGGVAMIARHAAGRLRQLLAWT